MSEERQAEDPAAEPRKTDVVLGKVSTGSISSNRLEVPKAILPGKLGRAGSPSMCQLPSGSTNCGEDSTATATPGSNYGLSTSGASPVEGAVGPENVTERAQVAKAPGNLAAVKEDDVPRDGQCNATRATEEPGQVFRAPPGLLEPDEPPSVGSRQHAAGNCSPCVWYHKPQGCTRGPDCGYCHVCPDGEIKARKKAKLAGIRFGQADDVDDPEDVMCAEEQADDDDEAFPVGASLPEDIPSAGSLKHGTLDCRPCAWFHKPGGCTNGKDCRHCHLCPEGEIRNRKKNKTITMRSVQTERPSSMGRALAMESIRSEALHKQSLPPPPGLGPPAMGKSYTEPVGSTLKPAEGSLSGLVSGPLESNGSAQHGTRDCRPCAWYWKQQGCENGKECRHCHLCEEGEIRSRKKAKATQLRGETPVADGDVTPAIGPASVRHRRSEMPVADGDVTPGVGPVSVRHRRSETAFAEGDMTPMMGLMPSLSAPFFHNPMVPMLPVMPTTPSAGYQPPSLGSVLHPHSCRPCAWFHKKPKGCENGAECRHCHLCPEGEIQARRKLKTSMLRQQLGTEMGEDVTPSHLEMQQLAQMEKQLIAQWQINVQACADMDWAAWHEACGDTPVEQSPFIGSIMDHSPGFLETIGEASPTSMEAEDILLHAAAESAKADARLAMSAAADEDASTLPAEGIAGIPKSPAILKLDESIAVESSNRSVVERGYSYSMLEATPAATVDHALSMVSTRSVVDPGTVTGSLTVTDEEVTPAAASSGPSASHLPSQGSALHVLGTCRPCAWFHKPSGCLNGLNCAHCHLCPEGELKNRKRAKENAMRVGAITPHSNRSLNTRSPRVVKIAPILGA